MNIIRKENEKHTFNEIDAGEIFEYENNIFMKFGNNASSGSIYNAICLKDGIIACLRFTGDEIVQPVTTNSVIH